MPTGHRGCDASLSSVPSAAGDAALLTLVETDLRDLLRQENTGWSLGNRLGLDKQKGSYALPVPLVTLLP